MQMLMHVNVQNYMQMGTVTIYLEQAGKVLAIDAFREAISFSVRNQRCESQGLSA